MLERTLKVVMLLDSPTHIALHGRDYVLYLCPLSRLHSAMEFKADACAPPFR